MWKDSVEYFSLSKFYLTEDELLNRIFKPQEYFKCEQLNNQLYDVGVEHCTSVLNIFPIIAMIFSIFFWNIVIYVTFLIFRECDGQRFPEGMLSRLLVIFKKWFVCDIYVILTSQLMLILLLISIDEITKMNFETNSQIISYSISIFILIFWFIFFLFTVLVNSKKKWGLCFYNKGWSLGYLGIGFKLSLIWRLYHSFSFLRKLFFVIIILSFPLAILTKIFLLIGVNLVFLLYVVIFRPFKRVKENFNEIFNELVIISFLIMLKFSHEKEDWTQIKSSTIITLFVSNVVVIIIIQILCFWVRIV